MITNEPMFTVADHSLREARACHAYIDAPHAAKDVPSMVQHSAKRGTALSERKEKKGNLRQMSFCVIAKGAAFEMKGKSVHRATYCAHNYPLPLLPSGPGGVGGITSRRTRHRNHFTIH